MRSHQNDSLAIAGRNLFDDEASSSNNTRAKLPTRPKTLHEHSHPNPFGSNEADKCEQNNLSEKVCMSGGDIYNDPSLLRFHQNDDTLPWGNSKRKKKGEDGPELIIRSKFKDEKQKKDDEDERLLSIFEKIHISLLFLEAMIHMPKGARVLKDILSHKEKLEKTASLVKLSEECSDIIQTSLP
nr:hypothetical protein [Tanacetum cinerariifolium]GEV96887.1 hypothetical protein [Tanacetum cinerariifolium]